MRVIDFLNSEEQRVKFLYSRNKATTLMDSVIYEINRIGYINRSDIQSILNNNELMNYNNILVDYDYLIDEKVVNILEMADYRTELMITKQYLQYYIDTGRFNLIAMPYPATDKEKTRNNIISIYLKQMLNKNT